MSRGLLATFVTAVSGMALPAQHGQQVDAEISCRVCHPGAVKGLAKSPHAALSAREDLRGRVCASCHGNLDAHAEALGRRLTPRPEVPAVSSASCAACHPAADYPTSRGLHLLAIIGSGAEAQSPPDHERIAALEQQETEPTIDWSGFAELGYRFVHHEGSRDAYRSDLDLEPTALLRDFEMRGMGSNTAWIDDVALTGRDLGDPRWEVGVSTTKSDRFDVDSRYRRSSYLYASSGDFHRVDRDSRDWSTTFAGGPAAFEVFGSYRDRREEGFWLTQRIGNQNLPVQTVVSGVASPRRVRAHEGELGVRGELGPLRVSLAGGFLEERSADRWTYSQPATANPGFVESEDLSSRAELEGPTGRLSIAHESGPVQIEFTGQVRDLERNVAASGTGTGFDTAAFTSTMTADGRGSGRLQLWQLDAGFECTETLRVQMLTRFRDYRERLSLQQVDVRTSGTTVTTNTTVDDETVQRLFDGELSFSWSPTDEFDMSVGYGLAREQLRVASPGPPDPQDFRRGHLRDDGFLADLRWRFSDDWTVRAEGRDFATDGVRLSELTPQRAREAKATLEWECEPGQVALFARHRHNSNDVSSHRLDAFATGIHGSATTDPVALSAGYTFADTESRTRTNFYFDPDPNPRSTLVGFRGETHTWTLSVTLTPHEALRAELGSTVTRTVGSFDVDTADLHAGLLWRCTENGAAGVEWRHVRYDDELGLDDWSADLVFLYWRQEW